jgi:hypothetical protein
MGFYGAFFPDFLSTQQIILKSEHLLFHHQININCPPFMYQISRQHAMSMIPYLQG